MVPNHSLEHEAINWGKNGTLTGLLSSIDWEMWASLCLFLLDPFFHLLPFLKLIILLFVKIFLPKVVVKIGTTGLLYWSAVQQNYSSYPTTPSLISSSFFSDVFLSFLRIKILSLLPLSPLLITTAIGFLRPPPPPNPYSLYVHLYIYPHSHLIHIHTTIKME